MSYGITTTGFKRKQLEDISAELTTGLKGIFGNSLNLSAQAPDGQVMLLVSAAMSDLWQLTQDAYDSFNPKAARGVVLSNLVTINGITRKGATSSRAYLTLTGTNGTVIPAGSIVSTSSGIQFATETSATISSGTASVYASCTATGPTPALAGTITTITTAVAGWATATNAADATLGTAVESDADLRIRRAQSVAFAGGSTIDSLIAGLGSVANVLRFKVYENTTNSTDGDGNVAHSIRVAIEGGTAQDIVNAIYARKPAGIETNGASFGTTIGADSNSHLIRYDVVSYTTIKIKVIKTTYSNYPADGDQQIKDAIVAFFSSQLSSGSGFGIGDTVVASRLYTPVNTVPGHNISAIYIAFSGTPTSSADLTIGKTARAVTTVADITVA